MKPGGPVHEVLRVLGERARAGSLPGKRRDGAAFAELAACAPVTA